MSFEKRVLERFFFDWSISDPIPKQTPDSFFPHLRMMFDFAPNRSILREAALTLAYANYDARLVSPEATAHAIRHYEIVIPLLIELIQKVEKSPNVLLTTQTMLSVILIGMYEVGAPCWRPNEILTHADDGGAGEWPLVYPCVRCFRHVEQGGRE
jgi:hypothetical protein